MLTFKFILHTFSLVIHYIEMYVHDIEVGTTVCSGTPVVLSETAATAFVDGCNLLGPVSFTYCIKSLLYIKIIILKNLLMMRWHV